MLSLVLMAAAANAAPLVPTSKWQVDFAESQCAATREYGTKDAPLTLLLKQPVEGDVIQLAVVVAKDGPAEANQLNARVTWGTDPSKKVTGLTYRAKGLARQFYLINLPRSDVDSAGAQTVLGVEGSGLDHHFQLPGLKSVLSVMDNCVKDLRQHWNMHEKDAPDTFKRRAQASLPRLFSSDDFPAVSIANLQDGQVSVVLLINPDGTVADCTLTQTSGIAALDAQTCAIIRQRAKYVPALDQNGKPARDVDHARIRWVIPAF